VPGSRSRASRGSWKKALDGLDAPREAPLLRRLMGARQFCAMFRPKGPTLCQPRPTAWVGEQNKMSPKGAALSSAASAIGPPLWGSDFIETVSQGDALG